MHTGRVACSLPEQIFKIFQTPKKTLKEQRKRATQRKEHVKENKIHSNYDIKMGVKPSPSPVSIHANGTSPIKKSFRLIPKAKAHSVPNSGAAANQSDSEGIKRRDV